MPEVFVSDTSISKAVSEALARGKLRRLGSRLYTRKLDDNPESLVRRNWCCRLAPGRTEALLSLEDSVNA